RHHIFEGQRFEVKPIRRVVVGRDGLWIAINHDRFEAGVSQSERCMATAVVKFNPLSYSVGSTAQDDDFLPVIRICLIFRLVSGVEVGSIGFKFGGTGINTFEYRKYPMFLSHVPDIDLC